MKTQPESKKGTANQRGFVLFTSYLLIGGLLVFSGGLYMRSSAFTQATERNRNKIIAFNMAESGVDLALATLKTNSTYAGAPNYTALGTQGGYTVAVCPPTCTGLTQPTATGVRLISASGFAPSSNNTARAYEARSIVAYGNLEGSGFNYAIFAGQSVAMSGNATTDGYDSSTGTYSSSTAEAIGNVGTDGTGNGVIGLSGNARISGDAQIGPGGNTATGITTSGNAQVTGTKSAASAAQNYAVKTSSQASLGALSISSNTTLTLAAGTYRYSSLSITGNASIRTTGAVTLYVDGAVSIGGNGVSTASNKPPNFILNVTTNSAVSISGNGNFYGAIYAPSSAISNSGNGEVYGAIVSKTYAQSGNGKIHYDQALQSGAYTTGSGTVGVLSWRETNTSAG